MTSAYRCKPVSAYQRKLSSPASNPVLARILADARRRGSLEACYRPIEEKIAFEGTEAERTELVLRAAEYNSIVPHEQRLVGRGSKDFRDLYSIMRSGALQHRKNGKNYGNLGEYSKNPEIMGGFRDTGWGVFVTTPEALDECFWASPGEYYKVPLERIGCILFPTPMVRAIRRAFPAHSGKIRGFADFAGELKRTTARNFPYGAELP